MGLSNEYERFLVFVVVTNNGKEMEVWTKTDTNRPIGVSMIMLSRMSIRLAMSRTRELCG
jgi:hypothetical protein